MYEIPILVITWYLALASAIFSSDLLLYLIHELYEHICHSFTSDLRFSVWNRNYRSEIHEKCLIWFHSILFHLAREIAEYLKTRQNFFIFPADTLEKLCLAMENIDYVPWDCQQR